MNKKIIIALSALIILTGAGCTAKNVISQQPSTPDPEPIACTMDAKQCADGSYVGRTGPNCEFVCPQTDTPSQTYQNWKEVIIGGVASFKIPSHCNTDAGAGTTYITCPNKATDSPTPEFTFSSDGIQVNMKRWEGLESPYWNDVVASMRIITPLTHAIQINIEK